MASATPFVSLCEANALSFHAGQECPLDRSHTTHGHEENAVDIPSRTAASCPTGSYAPVCSTLSSVADAGTGCRLAGNVSVYQLPHRWYRCVRWWIRGARGVLHPYAL